MRGRATGILRSVVVADSAIHAKSRRSDVWNGSVPVRYRRDGRLTNILPTLEFTRGALDTLPQYIRTACEPPSMANARNRVTRGSWGLLNKCAARINWSSFSISL